MPEELEEEFNELEEYSIKIDADDEEYWSLLVDCADVSLQCLLKIERARLIFVMRGKTEKELKINRNVSRSYIKS